MASGNPSSDEERDILQQLEMLEALALDENDGKRKEEECQATQSAESSPENRSESKQKVKPESKKDEFDELYDSDADSEDERWVRENLMVGTESDAHGRLQLTCPNCFSLLSVQGKPHEAHSAQYRAQHVLNCVTKRSGNTRKVLCKVCDAEVGARDKDDSYIFLDVIC